TARARNLDNVSFDLREKLARHLAVKLRRVAGDLPRALHEAELVRLLAADRVIARRRIDRDRPVARLGGGHFRSSATTRSSVISTAGHHGGCRYSASRTSPSGPSLSLCTVTSRK